MTQRPKRCDYNNNGEGISPTVNDLFFRPFSVTIRQRFVSQRSILLQSGQHPSPWHPQMIENRITLSKYACLYEKKHCQIWNAYKNKPLTRNKEAGQMFSIAECACIRVDMEKINRH